MKDSFILKYSYHNKFQKLKAEDLKRIILAIFDYEINSIVPDFSDNERLDSIFDFIKDDLDKNKSNYDRRCETSKWNGLFGGRPRKSVASSQEEENLKKPKKPKNPICNDLTDMNDLTDLEKENIKKKKSSKRKDSDSDKKEKYGTYKHVLLTSKEYHSLESDYKNHAKYIIQFLDDYIEEKGYKAKSHYLSIKRWVVDAYSEKLQKSSKSETQRGEPIPNWFDKQIENRQLTKQEETELDELLKDFE